MSTVQQRVEVAGLYRTSLLGVAMRVGQHREERRGVVPMLARSTLGHPQQLTESQWAGVDPDDAGELVDELPDVDSRCRAVSSARSNSGLSIARMA